MWCKGSNNRIECEKTNYWFWFFESKWNLLLSMVMYDDGGWFITEMKPKTLWIFGLDLFFFQINQSTTVFILWWFDLIWFFHFISNKKRFKRDNLINQNISFFQFIRSNTHTHSVNYLSKKKGLIIHYRKWVCVCVCVWREENNVTGNFITQYCLDQNKQTEKKVNYV